MFLYRSKGDTQILSPDNLSVPVWAVHGISEHHISKTIHLDPIVFHYSITPIADIKPASIPKLFPELQKGPVSQVTYVNPRLLTRVPENTIDWQGTGSWLSWVLLALLLTLVMVGVGTVVYIWFKRKYVKKSKKAPVPICPVPPQSQVPGQNSSLKTMLRFSELATEDAESNSMYESSSTSELV